MYYRDFSWNEVRNNWPLIATIPLVLVFNLSVIVFCSVYWRELLYPKAGASGKVSYVTSFVFAGLLLFVLYNSYKFARVISLLWRMSYDHSFDNGFPPKITVR